MRYSGKYNGRCSCLLNQPQPGLNNQFKHMQGPDGVNSKRSKRIHRHPGIIGTGLQLAQVRGALHFMDFAHGFQCHFQSDYEYSGCLQVQANRYLRMRIVS